MKFFVRNTGYALFLSLLMTCIGAGSVVDAHEGLTLIEGSLVRGEGDSKVYYIQNQQRHWITTEQAFNAQGFRWSYVIVVDPHRIADYPEGSQIGTTPTLVQPVDAIPQESGLLPDLTPVAPYDLRFAVEQGETRLRFTATFWNRGKGTFELNAYEGTQLGDQEFLAKQKILNADGTFLERQVGTLFWHEIHQHHHYDNFGNYRLEMVRPAAPFSAILPAVNAKTTFCMRDDQQIGAPAEGAKQPKTYLGCSSGRQGVSVGWADVYRSTLPDQYFNVTDWPAGIYKLAFHVDPQGHFAEIRRDNNVGMTFVELNPARRTLRIIGTASPYEATTNRFPDGTLIQAEGDPKVYSMYKNRKSWMRSEAVIKSYGLNLGLIYVLPRRSVDVIPMETLVRVKGTTAVYVLNAAGFKRRILNPDIFKSYGWSLTSVADINQTEFDSIPLSDLIVRIGDDRVYSISGRRMVGMFDELHSLGLDSESVHNVNEKDFQTLIGPAVLAQNLTIPWDIGFLPDGDMIVTERTGTLRRIGKQNGTMTVPGVMKGGEGGLMGIAVDPNFVTNQYIYLYYTTDEGGRKNRVTRFRLDGVKLVLDRIILDGIPSAIYHDGGQVDFGPDGKLYIATGDATQPDLAQDKSSLAGKVLRINSDGSIPGDNPFGNAVWSYGHRNPQGFAWDPSGRMYAAEHGPSGELGLCCRDEVNRIEKGGNYGWPIITGNQTREGMIAPAVQSGVTDTWAPSGIAYAAGKLYFTGLRGSALYQTTIDGSGGLINFRTVIPDTYGRIRAAVMGPDGLLYITTSNRDGRGTVRTGDDKILRVSPDIFPR